MLYDNFLVDERKLYDYETEVVDLSTLNLKTILYIIMYILIFDILLKKLGFFIP